MFRQMVKKENMEKIVMKIIYVICHMSIEKLENLLNDTNEAFGHGLHGLCLAYSLLIDLQ